jgi:translocation and assembly module TamB
VEGRLDLAARILGTAEPPQIEAQLAIALDSEVPGIPTDVNLQLTYRRAAVRLQGQGRRNGNRLFGLEGGFDLDLRLLPFQFRPRPGSLDLTLTADRLQTAQLPLPLPETWEIEGLVDLQLRAVGDLTAPAFSGYAALHEGRLRLGDAGLSFEAFSARIRLEPERIRIDRVSLRGDREGTLEVAGTISLDGWQPSDYNLQFTGANLQIPYRDVAVARMNADLKFAGSRSRPSLTGRLDVLQGRIDLDRIAAGMPADIEIVGNQQPEDRRWVYSSGFEESGFFDVLTADVLMVIRGDTWVKGKGVNAEISGNLELTKQAQQPFRLIGTLETVRGNYKFQGKLFRITAGTVSFTGQPEPNPELNIEARTQIRRVDIVVAISGQADRLRLELSSDPPMEQSDILSYLVFGRPSSELRWQQSASVENAALGMTGNLAATELEGIFEDALNLDMLTFEFSDEEFDQSKLALGKYVARNIFVTYRHGIASRGFGQVEVDYQINRNFTLQAQLGDELSSGVDLIWELDF